MSQELEILSHIKRTGSITPLEALNEYGCMRLAARIFDLRSRGHNIVSIEKNVMTPNGRKKWAEYRLGNE